jgi:hypothetical protein
MNHDNRRTAAAPLVCQLDPVDTRAIHVPYLSQGTEAVTLSVVRPY